LIDSRVGPFVAFFDQHNGDILNDGVFATAGAAHQPGIPVKIQLAFIFVQANRAQQDLKQF
jgi:hypothetical protein